MGDVTLGIQLAEQGARGAALEAVGGGWRLRWRGEVEGSGRESLASDVARELDAAGVAPDAVALALPASPGSVYQTLQLPPLRGEELATVAENELRREMGADTVEGLEVQAWQFGGREGANTLVVGVPSEMLAGALTFGEALDLPVLSVTVPPLTLHHGLLALDGLDPDRATGLTWIGDQFGFVAYVRGARWILIHHFPVPPEEVGTEGLLREVKQSFTFLRSRAPDADLDRMILAGPGLGGDDLPSRLEQELAGARVETFSFPASLDLEGMPHGTEFLRRQGDHAVALLLAARPEASPLDFLPLSAKLPRIRRRFLKGTAATVGAGLLATVLHAGLAWNSLSGSGDRLDRLESELSSLGPRLEQVQRERARERASRAALHLADLAEQQSVLGPAALRRLSRAVGEGITVDSLAWSTDGTGWGLRLQGRATGPTASRASRRVSEMIADLSRSPVFRAVNADEQEISRLSGDAFQVRFAIEAQLLDGAAQGG